jgi:DNA-binding MarR family transcriptional regulator
MPTETATENPALREDIDELADILMALQRCFLSNLSKELSKGHVSFPQFLLLGYLRQQGAMIMSEIAERMGHTTAAATGLVDRLESLQYVQRAHDRRDRRKVFVSITRKGNALVDRIRQDIVENLDRMMQQLTPEEQKGWIQIYRKIYTICRHP